MINAEQVFEELRVVKGGVVCIMATGGYKFKPQGLTDQELSKKAEEAMTQIYRDRVCLRAAEEVIRRWGKESEYEMFSRQLDDRVAALAAEATKQAKAKKNGG